MISITILAIIQALTEFIPVSSSGHLIAAQELTSLSGGLVVDVALHFGTLLAIVAYFFERIIKICTNVRANKKLILNIIITSIPAAIAGFFFSDFFESDVRGVGVVIVMLVLVGVLMIYSDKLFKPNKRQSSIEKISRSDALLVGFGQALALIPGTSRSGATMLAAKSRGFSNATAAEYSFLAGIPVIAGATLKTLTGEDARATLSENGAEIAVGVLVSFVVGLMVLNFLIKYISKNGLALFGWYRLALALVLFIIWVN